ncbi:MAG: NAD-dependent epimerase/dehydratase family protein [Halieaceae bacterium]|jgi:UDP-glucose 4-epimerase|nr:NAD-dependent epimerase/dehydratase family protein [Halieaceae bacterium]
MKTIVVLGGSGFVGRRLCPALVGAGHEVFSISRSPVIRRAPGVTYIDCNFDNVHQLGQLYQRADTVFHLACDTTPATSASQSSLEITANLLPSLRLLEYLEQSCTTAITFVSSGGTIYGNPGVAHCDETIAVSPISYYGAGKASLELFLETYSRQTGNPVQVLRPSNLYGPGQLAKQQFGLVPTLMNAIRDDGTFFVMGDGSQQRDFLFIDDFVTLALATVDQLATGCDTYNVGSGTGVALLDLIRLTEEVTGKQVALDFSASRKVDVHSIVLESRKAAAHFNWAPSTLLKDGLRQTWDWITAE